MHDPGLRYAIYRDNSKRVQPLSSGSGKGEKKNAAAPGIILRSASRRHHQPRDRLSGVESLRGDDMAAAAVGDALVLRQRTGVACPASACEDVKLWVCEVAGLYPNLNLN